MNEQRERLFYEAFQALHAHAFDDEQTLPEASKKFLKDAYREVRRDREWMRKLNLNTMDILQ